MALIVIVVGTVETFFGGMWPMMPSGAGHERRDVWLRYARWLVAGLTFQLAADILETAVSSDWDTVGRIAAIAVIRTFLNYFLERDLTDIRQRQRSRAPKGRGSDRKETRLIASLRHSRRRAARRERAPPPNLIAVRHSRRRSQTARGRRGRTRTPRPGFAAVLSALLCRLDGKALAGFALRLLIGRSRTLWLLRLRFLCFLISLDLALRHFALPRLRRIRFPTLFVAAQAEIVKGDG